MNPAECIIFLGEKLKKLKYKLISQILYKNAFGYFGSNSKIIRPLLLKNVRFISIGKNITIGDFAVIIAQEGNTKPPEINIRDGATIGNFNHIVAYDKVIIEENVLTADRVYISDNFHDYTDISVPICDQPIKSKGITAIGAGSWIGENSVIINCKIGRHCIVAANSVVNSDIPDYCLAAGSPAKIKKKYDTEKKCWRQAENE